MVSVVIYKIRQGFAIGVQSLVQLGVFRVLCVLQNY
jgi:hypothetical protein